MSQPSREQVAQHAFCLQLRDSAAFQWYIAELSKDAGLAHREVCAEVPRGSREFHAGRLSAFSEAIQFVDTKYNALKQKVEVIS